MEYFTKRSFKFVSLIDSLLLPHVLQGLPAAVYVQGRYMKNKLKIFFLCWKIIFMQKRITFLFSRVPFHSMNYWCKTKNAFLFRMVWSPACHVVKQLLWRGIYHVSKIWNTHMKNSICLFSSSIFDLQLLLSFQCWLAAWKSLLASCC